jgi:hypothetical protein
MKRTVDLLSASNGLCHRCFRSRCYCTHLAGRSSRRCRDLRSTPTGALIRSAQIAWPVPLQPGPELPQAGLGPRSGNGEHGISTTFRSPPAPYREAPFNLGPGRCCICGQPVYRFGWHIDLWGRGPNRNVEWRAACVASWRLWTAPRTHLQSLKRLQRCRCAETGKRLIAGAEVDHRVPLHQVWYERRGDEWPSLLAFWGLPNLQVINRDAHAAKCLAEAQARWASRGR